MSIRVERVPSGGGTTLLALSDENRLPAVAVAARELRELLRLEPGSSEFSLVVGRIPSGGIEIAIQSRSL